MNDTLSQPRPGPLEASPKKGRGCFFYGCLTFVALSVLIGAVVGYGIYRVYSTAKEAVMEYSDTTPRELPTLTSTPEEYGQVKARLVKFSDDVKAGKASTLTLSSRDLNILVNFEPDLAFARNRIWFTLEGDRIKGEVSVPLEQLSIPGRYVNGSASLTAEVRNAELIVLVRDFEVKGRPLPDDLMSQVKTTNLANIDKLSPETQAALKSLESVVVKDGTITLKAKSQQPTV